MGHRRAPPYTAVSYTWGPTEPLQQIVIDGKPFTIRENLWQFWNSYRGLDWTRTSAYIEKPTEYLWVDQLCIDQENTAEKSKQVQAMGKIFGRAKLVISWLGAKDHNSRVVRGAFDEFPLWMEHQRSSNQPPIVEEFTVFQEITEEICGFLRRPYWSRLWIIQELVLSKTQFYTCGDWILASEHLRLIDWMDAVIAWTDTFWRPIEGACTMMEMPMNLPDLVLLFHRRGFWKCHDKRDMVYGLLGMAKERMEVDYTKPPEEIENEVLEMAEAFTGNRPKSTMPILGEKMLRGKSDEERKNVKDHGFWKYDDEWTALKLELKARLVS